MKKGVSKKQYSQEFKLQALKLAEDLGSVGKAARELGVHEANIHRWKRDFIPVQLGNGQKKTISELESENRKLFKENNELKKINQVLKHVTDFFSQDQLR